MTQQRFEMRNAQIREQFLALKRANPEKFGERLKLSWSNWGFGMESLETSLKRLKHAGLEYIELHGNHYGPDLGYRAEETLALLGDYGMKVSGVCGMFSADNDLSSNRAVHQQEAIDYIRREAAFTQAVGGHYLLVVPGAVGRPGAYDAMEFDRSAETLRLVADVFVQHGVKAAIEPIRSAEVSLVHSIADAIRYIEAVDHPGVEHINGDVYHMQSEERHIGEAILAAGERLVNLHMADSNRCALGDGALDLDTIIMALYILDFQNGNRFVTFEPLGPGGDPYPAKFGKPEPVELERLVRSSCDYFREREEAVLALE